MNLKTFETAILSRLKELGARVQEIDLELSHTLSPDLADQAIDLEDDEVLEGVGIAAQTEIGLLKDALGRIKDKSYGICLSCGGPISEERLEAVLHAPLCRRCANASAR